MGLRSAFSRWTMNTADIEAAELGAEVDVLSAQHLADCRAGDLVTIHGTVCSVTIRPRAMTMAFESELYDGSGRVRLIWLGRRDIPGISAGRRLIATGRLIIPSDGGPTLYNPVYTLKPRGDE